MRLLEAHQQGATLVGEIGIFSLLLLPISDLSVRIKCSEMQDYPCVDFCSLSYQVQVQAILPVCPSMFGIFFFLPVAKVRDPVRKARLLSS